MKNKSIREKITNEIWEKIEDELVKYFESASDQLTGTVVEESELELELSLGYNRYFQTPISHITEVIEQIYPFVRGKSIEIHPWTSDLNGYGYSRDMNISYFEMKCNQQLSEEEREVLELIKEELLEIYDELGVKVIAYIEELIQEEVEGHGDGYVKIAEVS